jgi:hypothetical protein
MGMDRAKIKDLADYVKELEEGLVESDYDHIAMQTELLYLYQIIKMLMDATFEGLVSRGDCRALLLRK